MKMNSSIRHWNQHFDPSADLVFLRNMTLNGVKVKRGSPVPQEVKDTLGPMRLKVWWQGKIIALAPVAEPAGDVKQPKQPKVKAPKAPKPPKQPKNPTVPATGE